MKMASDIGTSKAAQDLGVPVDTLYGWIRKSKQYGERAHVGSGNKRNSATDDEKAQLIRRNKELERANQILKEALSFFVVSQKK